MEHCAPHTRAVHMKGGWLESAPWTSSKQFSHVLWSQAHNHRLLRACLPGSKRKLPPPACQTQLELPSVVCRVRGVQFPGTVYICNQGPLSSAWVRCISYSPSAYSLCTNSAWELAWTLQEIQSLTTDHLCMIWYGFRLLIQLFWMELLPCWLRLRPHHSFHIHDWADLTLCRMFCYDLKMGMWFKIFRCQNFDQMNGPLSIFGIFPPFEPFDPRT